MKTQLFVLAIAASLISATGLYCAENNNNNNRIDITKHQIVVQINEYYKIANNVQTNLMQASPAEAAVIINRIIPNIRSNLSRFVQIANRIGEGDIVRSAHYINQKIDEALLYYKSEQIRLEEAARKASANALGTAFNLSMARLDLQIAQERAAQAQMVAQEARRKLIF